MLEELTTNRGAADLIKVPCSPKNLKDYSDLLDQETINELHELTIALHGLRVVHINATPAGGGVAEILRSLVPLMQGGGLLADWHVIDPNFTFFQVTKKIHNGLQGDPIELSTEEEAIYLKHNEQLAEELSKKKSEIDLLVLHDPQVLPSLPLLGWKNSIWHCHIDTSTPNQKMRQLVLPQIWTAPSYIVSMPHYVMDDLTQRHVSVFPPAIDPLSPKNSPLSPTIAKNTLIGLGLDMARPLVTQISRFDPWKDPCGVIDAFRMARKSIPNLQLALVGAMVAKDDPESTVMLKAVQKYAGSDPDIHIYSDAADGSDVPINAFQSLSSVIVQKSLREGFGLTVSEAMWKKAAVIGGNCGGIRYQIEDRISGHLVNNPEECASRIVDLITHPKQRAEIGTAAKERVRKNFLMPRLLLDYLRLFQDMLQNKKPETPTNATYS